MTVLIKTTKVENRKSLDVPFWADAIPAGRYAEMKSQISAFFATEGVKQSFTKIESDELTYVNEVFLSAVDIDTINAAKEKFKNDPDFAIIATKHRGYCADNNITMAAEVTVELDPADFPEHM